MQYASLSTLPIELLCTLRHPPLPSLRPLHLFRRQLTTAIAAGAEGMPAQREDKSAPKKEARKPKPPKKSTIAPTVAKSRTKRDFDPVKKIFTLNREIDAASRTGRYLDAVRVATQIKRLGLSPNRITYLYLLRALVRAGAIAEATALFNEMADSADHPPDVDICNVMLIAAATSGEHPWQVLDYMEKHGIALTSVSHEQLITRTCATGDLEWALLQRRQLGGKLQPSTYADERIIRLAGDIVEPAIASDNLYRLTRHGGVLVSAETTAHVLRAAARRRALDITRRTWARLVHEWAHTVDEGTCVDVLHTAAGHADVKLAHEVFDMLQSTNVPLAEHHLLPILEAHLRAGEIVEAFAFVRRMRALAGDEAVTFAGVGRTFYDLLLYQTGGKAPRDRHSWLPQASVEVRLDTAEDLARRHAPIDPAIFDALVHTAVVSLDLPRARRLLGTSAHYLGPGTLPSALAYALVIGLALDGHFPAIATQLYDHAARCGLDTATDPALLEAGMRIHLAAGGYEPCTDALLLFDDLKHALADAAPSAVTYRHLVQGLVAADDARAGPMIHEAIQAGHRLSLADYAALPKGLRKATWEWLTPGERNRYKAATAIAAEREKEEGASG